MSHRFQTLLQASRQAKESEVPTREETEEEKELESQGSHQESERDDTQQEQNFKISNKKIPSLKRERVKKKLPMVK